MAITLVQYASAEALWYVPKYGGNRTDPCLLCASDADGHGEGGACSGQVEAANPMVVKLIPAMANDLRKLEGSASRGRTNMTPTEYLNELMSEVLGKYVLEVSKLFVLTPSGEQREITTAVEMMVSSPDALLLEIYGAIRDHSQLEAGVKKG